MERWNLIVDIERIKYDDCREILRYLQGIIQTVGIKYLMEIKKGTKNPYCL